MFIYSFVGGGGLIFFCNSAAPQKPPHPTVLCYPRWQSTKGIDRVYRKLRRSPIRTRDCWFTVRRANIEQPYERTANNISQKQKMMSKCHKGTVSPEMRASQMPCSSTTVVPHTVKMVFIPPCAALQGWTVTGALFNPWLKISYLTDFFL